jgi:hypothetical protein
MKNAWSGTRVGSNLFCIKQPSHDEDPAVSRLNPIGAAIAVLALTTLPAIAQQVKWTPNLGPGASLEADAVLSW